MARNRKPRLARRRPPGLSLDPMSRRLRPLADREAILALGLAAPAFSRSKRPCPLRGRSPCDRSARSGRPTVRARPSGYSCSEPRGSASCSATRPCERCGSRRPSTTTPRGSWPSSAGGSPSRRRPLLLANFLCRCHPERVVARAVARAGIVTVIAAGLLQFMAITSAMLQEASRGLRRFDGRLRRLPPWASLVPALAVGAAWLVLLTGDLGHRRARRRRSLRPY